MGPVRAAWGRGKVAWGGVGLSRVEYHGTDAQASLGRVGPVRAAWGRGKVAWGGVGLSRVEYHGTDAEASLTSGRRPSGVGGYIRAYIHMVVCREEQCRTAGVDRPGDSNELSVSRVRLVASIVYGLIVIPTLIGWGSLL